MKALQFGAFALAITAAGCNHLPESASLLNPASIERRQVETRRFDGVSEADLLAACAAVLQDLGFSIDASESRLGLVTASKDRSAKDGGQIARAVVIAILTGVSMPLDKDQTIRASVVVFPAQREKNNNHLVRISLQRVVRTTDPRFVRSEWLKDPELYQGFFTKLSQSVFLEGHKI
jgi:hypothetical protein